MVQHVSLFASDSGRAGTRPAGDRPLGARRLAAPWRGIGLVALLLVLATALAAGDQLTVMTWNVENYVTEDRMVDGVYRKAYPKPEAEKTALRAVIRAVHPDVLALQEMGPAPFLEELQRDLAAEGLPFPYAALGEGPDEARHVAVLARRPLVRVVKHGVLSYPLDGAATQVKRGVLEAAVACGRGEVTFFVVHLKSRFTTRRDDPQSARQRTGEAGAVRDLVLSRAADPARARFLILGDCNDEPQSAPLLALSRRGPNELVRILPAADADGKTWTHYYRKADVYSCVDYIFVSPNLLDSVANGRAEIPNLPDVRRASDHRPVVVRLRCPTW